MENFAFHIIKTNLIASLFIAITLFLSRFLKSRYTAMWKYFMWLVIALFLLFPINLPDFAPLHMVIPAENPTAYQTELPAQPAQSGELSKRETPDTASSGIPAGTASEELIVYAKNVSLYGLLQLFMVLWGAGVVLLIILRMVLYRFSMRSLRRWSLPESDRNIQALYALACKKKRIARPPKLMVNTKITSPVLASLRGTVLYLPSNVYSQEELLLIFYHELSHYKCRDLWYKMLLLCVTTVYWFNPLLYLMVREAEKDLENLCDSNVIEHCTESEQQLYSLLLLKTASGQRFLPYPAASLNDSTLVFKERIHYMRKTRTLKTRITPALLLCAVLICSGTAISCSTVPQPEKQPVHASSEVQAFKTKQTQPPQNFAKFFSVPADNDLAGLPSDVEPHRTEEKPATAGTAPRADDVDHTNATTPGAADDTNFTNADTLGAPVISGSTPADDTAPSAPFEGSGSVSDNSSFTSETVQVQNDTAPSKGSSGMADTPTADDTSGTNEGVGSNNHIGGNGNSNSGTNPNTDYSTEVIYPKPDDPSRTTGTVVSVNGTAFEMKNDNGETTWYWFDPNLVDFQNGSNELTAGDTVDLVYYPDTKEVQNIFND